MIIGMNLRTILGMILAMILVMIFGTTPVITLAENKVQKISERSSPAATDRLGTARLRLLDCHVKNSDELRRHHEHTECPK